MMKIKLNKKLTRVALNYLRRNRLMTLGTSCQGKPWLATVFFAFDEKFNILFFSREDTRHCKNIKKNKYVSIAINQDWGKPGLVKGLQMAGRASKGSRDKYKSLYLIYRSRYPWADE